MRDAFNVIVTCQGEKIIDQHNLLGVYKRQSALLYNRSGKVGSLPECYNTQQVRTKHRKRLEKEPRAMHSM